MGIDPAEGPEVLRAYREREGYPWPVAVGNRETLETYRVISTSIKYAIDRRGLITFSRGYGVGSAQDWAEVLRSLAAA